MFSNLIKPGPLVVSTAVHLVLIAVAVYSWQSSSQSKHVTPKYIEARLVKLKAAAPKEKPKARPKKVDLTKKQAPPKKVSKPASRVKALEKKKALDAEKKRKEAEQRMREQRRLAEKKREEDRQREAERQKKIQELEQAMRAEELAVADKVMENEAQSYRQAISQRIEQYWSRPPSATNSLRCELLIQLVPTGRVVSVSVVNSSGNPAFDRSAEQAVKKAEAFPEIKKMSPQVFEKYYRQLRLSFNPQDLRR